MFIKRIFNPCLSINSYIVGDEKTKRCIIVDPSRHVVPFIIQAQKEELEITDIVETHVHADFVSGAKELKHQLNEKPLIYCSGLGGKERIPHYADVIVRQETEIKMGDIRMMAIHTPGHTPEHVSWLCYDLSRSDTSPWLIFTGDCLFVGGVGRPDLLGVQEMKPLSEELYNTLFTILGKYPDFLEILPGHGAGSLCGKMLQSKPSSTLGYERQFNPFLIVKEKKGWVEDLLANLPPVPNYFKKMKRMNIEGPALLNSLKCKAWNDQEGLPFNQLFLIDIRHPEIFAERHIKGSINIPLSNSFCQWAGWMLPESIPIGLITENFHLYSEIVDQLRLLGVDQDIWVIQVSEKLSESLCPFSSFPMIEASEVQHEVNPNRYLLDVRTEEEWNAEHIPKSHHIDLIQLQDSMDILPKEKQIILICRSGHRASLAASILQKNGIASVGNLRGGILAWKQAGLKLV